MKIPISWTFQRKGIMPIIEVKGQSPAKEGEFILIQNAVEIIEKANEFKGIPYQNTPSPSNGFSLTVSFSLIFPSDKELTSFREIIQQRK